MKTKKLTTPQNYFQAYEVEILTELLRGNICSTVSKDRQANEIFCRHTSIQTEMIHSKWEYTGYRKWVEKGIQRKEKE